MKLKMIALVTLVCVVLSIFSLGCGKPSKTKKIVRTGTTSTRTVR